MCVAMMAAMCYFTPLSRLHGAIKVYAHVEFVSSDGDGNLLFGHNVSRMHDFHCVVFSRYITDSIDSDSVYLDQNFVEYMCISLIYT